MRAHVIVATGVVAGLLVAVGLLPGAAAGGPGDGRSAELLRRLHHDGQTSLALGEAAWRRGATAVGRAFGERLVRDHRLAARRLEQQAVRLGVDLTVLPGRTPEEQRWLGRRDARLARLDERSGPALDREVASLIIVGHVSLLDRIRHERHRLTDARLRSLVDRLVPLLGQHRQLAGHVLARLERDGLREDGEP